MILGEKKNVRRKQSFSGMAVAVFGGREASCYNPTLVSSHVSREFGVCTAGRLSVSF